MVLNPQEIQALHEKAISLASQFHSAEVAMIEIIQEIDLKQVYLEFGFTSLFDYAVRALRLSEANASNFVVVARKSREVPELKAALERGDFSISKARKITPVLTVENQAYWLNLARSLPKHKLEREVARVRPETLTPERARYVSGERLELKLGVSELTMKKLRRAQDIVSQKTRKASKLEATLEALLDFYLERKDPVEKAKRHVAKKDGEKVDAHASVPGTRDVPAKIRHSVFYRDRGRCTHKDPTGRRCENTRWVDIHHHVPLSQGGTNEVHNLRTLCSAHHRMLHAGLVGYGWPHEGADFDGDDEGMVPSGRGATSSVHQSL